MKKIYLIAAVAALLSGLLLFFYLNGIDENDVKDQKTVPMVQVVTVAEDIPAFEMVTAEKLTLTSLPEDYAPVNALHSLEEAEGLVSDGTLFAGEVLLDSMIGSLEEKNAGMSYRVPEGSRAMTLRVDVVTGVGGYISTGDYIDLLLYRGESRDEETHTEYPAYTKIVGENIEVLAAGDVLYDGTEIYTTLTLALTPDQCNEVYAAQAMCSFEGKGWGLTALLRGAGDTAPLSHTVNEVGKAD